MILLLTEESKRRDGDRFYNEYGNCDEYKIRTQRQGRQRERDRAKLWCEQRRN